MSSETAMMALCGVEFALMALLGLQFWRKGLHRQFHATGAYFALQSVVSLPAMFFLYQSMRTRATFWCLGYFLISWGAYIISTILLFLVCMEIFSWAFAPLEGFVRTGRVIFSVVALVALLLAVPSAAVFSMGYAAIPRVASGFMRSVSALELGLLAVLCLSMSALRIDVCDFPFGSSLVMGVMAANDYIHTLSSHRDGNPAAPMQFIYEGVILVALGIWNVYVLLPQRERKPIFLPASSIIYRWNEIASALGHTGTKVVIQPQGDSLFLADVENVVEKVLARTMKKRESES